MILVTGANGFVGRALCGELSRRGLPYRAAVRDTNADLPKTSKVVVIRSLSSQADVAEALKGIDTIIHLAARVHVMKEKLADPLTEFRRVNVQYTEQLARAAVMAGVRRFVFVSSIKVNGDETPAGGMFSESSELKPLDPYGVSKMEAEQVLLQVAADTGLEVVIVRPPLIYGPNVKGNFATMMSVLRLGIPLPLANVGNVRSFVFVGNLVDALIICARHSAAVGRTFLISDGDDVSTPDLLRRIGEVIGRPARLLPCPVFLLRVGGMLLGKSAQMSRLLGSLRVDNRKICRELGWRPPYSLQEGLYASVNCQSES